MTSQSKSADTTLISIQVGFPRLLRARHRHGTTINARLQCYTTDVATYGDVNFLKDG